MFKEALEENQRDGTTSASSTNASSTSANSPSVLERSTTATDPGDGSIDPLLLDPMYWLKDGFARRQTHTGTWSAYMHASMVHPGLFEAKATQLTASTASAGDGANAGDANAGDATAGDANATVGDANATAGDANASVTTDGGTSATDSTTPTVQSDSPTGQIPGGAGGRTPTPWSMMLMTNTVAPALFKLTTPPYIMGEKVWHSKGGGKRWDYSEGGKSTLALPECFFLVRRDEEFLGRDEEFLWRAATGCGAVDVGQGVIKFAMSMKFGGVEDEEDDTE